MQKRLITPILVTLLLLTSCLTAQAACPTRILKQVCEVCQQTALTKLQTDASVKCPVCEPVNCPTASLSCIKPDSFSGSLRTRYTITTNLLGTDNDLTLRFNTLKSQDSQNAFSYEVRAQDYRLINNDGFGYIFYDIVSFSLPVYIGSQLFSYTCTGGIDSSSVIKGYCSTIAPNTNGQPQTYSGSFIGIPD